MCFFTPWIRDSNPAGLAMENPPNKTQKKPPKKNHLKGGFLVLLGFLKLTSVFGAKVTIFLVKCFWKSLIWVVINVKHKYYFQYIIKCSEPNLML
jgi:hypothetical protein